MTAPNSTAINHLLRAYDLLYKTETIVSFIQSITLMDERPDSELTLDPTQVAGLYYVINSVRENMKVILGQIHSANQELKHSKGVI